MAATSRDIDAPSEAVPLDRDIFMRQCELKLALTEEQRAALVGVDRGTIRRWLDGDTMPLLPMARRVARILDSTVNDLWPEK